VKLLLDLGNSRLKWSWETGGKLSPMVQESRQAQPAAVLVDAIAAPGGRPQEIRLVSTAGPAATSAFAAALAQKFHQAPRLARSVAAVPGLRNGYDDPSQLGADRWLALRAASASFPLPVCVVDVGTAVTVDLVDAGGMHCGGVIAPGVRLMVESLGRETGDLQRLSAGRLASQEPGIFGGRDTRTAIRLGAQLAITGLVSQALATLGGGACAVVVTGGDGPEILPHLPGEARLVTDLVLRGLLLATPGEFI
jgi:type III pantothenate kinase